MGKGKPPKKNNTTPKTKKTTKIIKKQTKAKKVPPKKKNAKTKKVAAKIKSKSKVQKNASKAKKKEEKESKTSNQSQRRVSPTVDAQSIWINSHVVYDDGKKFFAASLMWSDVKHNNNKYYIIQLLQEKANPKCFQLFTRWGRVGHRGQQNSLGCSTVQQGIKEYEKKYKEKTRKGYTEIEIVYGDEEEEKNEKPKKKGKKEKKEKKTKNIKSKLPERVREFLKLIFNKDMMKAQMINLGYDVKKMPLGKLSKDTIKKGYEALSKISEVLEGKKKGDLADLSSKFYTHIPHDFGFQKLSNFIINTKDKLKAKLEMVESLGYIEIANKLMEVKDKAEEEEEDINEIDKNYKQLNCKLEPVETNSKEFKIIDDYVHNCSSNRGFKIHEILRVDREDEEKRFKKKIGNNLLLWHGSRLTNYVGILSQGLRIQPPEVPATDAGWFGKGIYFADVISYSWDYCHPQNNMGVMLLCKVAIGKHQNCYEIDYYANKKLPKDCSSTKAPGNEQPLEKNFAKLRDFKVPLGPVVDVNLKKSAVPNTEWVVYDVAQAKIEYILKITS